LSKSCQKVVKKLYKFKTSGEDDDDDEKEEEEDWWIQDQVATLSHLVKTKKKSHKQINLELYQF
jgi:hypothetical protein